MCLHSLTEKTDQICVVDWTTESGRKIALNTARFQNGAHARF